MTLCKGGGIKGGIINTTLFCSMVTKNGIIYDLKNSFYYVKDGDFTYYFSSRLHKDKFLKLREKERDEINHSLSKRFKMNINLSLIADLRLYDKIETRGFLINFRGCNFKCLHEIKLNGVNKIEKNLLPPCVNLTQKEPV